MNIEKFVAIIYMVITLLALACVNVTNITYIDALPGIIYIWLCYCLFLLAMRVKKETSFFSKFFVNNKCTYLFQKREALLVIVVALSTVLTAWFYTGQTPVTVLNNLKNGNSLYTAYQSYFASNKLGVMSLKKIPFILMNAFNQFALIYSYIYIWLVKKKIYIKDMLVLGILSLFKIYFGITRGTNFEMFELAFLVIFCYMLRKEEKNKQLLKIMVSCGGLVICCLLFSYVLSQRGVVGNSFAISRGIYTDAGQTLTKNYPALAKLIASLSAYFCFGTFYLSYFFNHFYFESFSNIVYGILPAGYQITQTILPDPTNTEYLYSVNWTPDMMGGIVAIGVWAAPIMYIIVGRIIKQLNTEKEKYKENVLIYMLQYYMVYQLFSFPVGNFIRISSANKIVLFSLIVYLIIGEKIKWMKK